MRTRSFTPLPVFLLLSMALAGCTGGDAPDDDPFQDDLDASDTTGVIRGVVVDETVTPVADAVVQIQGTERSATTDEDGRFGFGDVDAGTQFLQVSKPGYESAQQGVDVVAGKRDPGAVKVLLVKDPEYNPYFQEFVFEGYIECGTAVLALCSVPNIGPEILCGVGDVCVGDITNDAFLVDHPVDGVPTWVQSEMVWESTQALGDQMDLLHSWDCGDVYLCDHTASGTSPLLLTEDADGIEEIGLGTENENLTVRVFSSGAEESMGLAGFTVQQQFKIFTHVFYGYTPPEGWRFSEDSTVPRAE